MVPFCGLPVPPRVCCSPSACLKKLSSTQQTRPLCFRLCVRAPAVRRKQEKEADQPRRPAFVYGVRKAADGSVQKDGSFLGWIIKNIVFWLFSVVVVLGLLIAVLPALISTSLGLEAAVMGANIMMPGVLEVQKVSAGWQRPLQVEGIVVKDGIKKLVPVVSIEKVTTSKTLWDIIKGERFEVFMLGPTVNAFPDEVGTIPVMRYAQKTGVLKREKQEDTPIKRPTTGKEDDKDGKKTMVRTKRFEEWMAHTAKKVKKEPKPLRRTFVQTHVDMTAEIRSQGMSILVNQGKILVTREMRSLLGDYMHCIFAHGAEDVDTISEELNLSTDWIETYEDMKREDEEDLEADPILLNVDSPNIAGSLRGWKVDRVIELERPGEARITLTPAFSRECLALLNPLLTNVVSLKQGTKVQAQLSTKTMSLPSDVLDVHLYPFRLTAGSGPFWNSLLKLLKIKERGLSEGQPLQVWTSAIDCSIIDNEIARCNRCDMLLGPRNRGVHVVVWGDCILNSEELKMWLGIPSDTLERIGYKNLRADYVLPIPLKGTVDSPVVDWGAASEEIGKLAFQQMVGNVAEEELQGFESYWRTQLLTAAQKHALQNKKKLPEASVPAQTNPLPWEENGHS